MSQRAKQNSAVGDFTAVYTEWFDSVERWLRALGVPESEREDIAQEVFLVVRRKLAGFDGGNLAGWLYTICARTASDHRRRSWFRRFFHADRDIDPTTVSREAGPAELLEQKERRARLHRLLRRISEKRRITFAMYEIEEMTGEEIAAALDIPLSTVWTRLYHARKDFLALVAEAHKERA